MSMRRIYSSLISDMYQDEFSPQILPNSKGQLSFELNFYLGNFRILSLKLLNYSKAGQKLIKGWRSWSLNNYNFLILFSLLFYSLYMSRHLIENIVEKHLKLSRKIFSPGHNFNLIKIRLNFWGIVRLLQ